MFSFFAQLPVGVTELSGDVTASASSLFDTAVTSAQNGHWTIALGAIVLLLVMMLRNVVGLEARVGKGRLPWVAVGLGVAVHVGVCLISGKPLETTWASGILTGMSAIGLWELVFKHIKAK